jgi:hypothetical protein
MGDDLQRSALSRDLARRLELANHDELRVLDRILVRIELGRERYGSLAIGAPRAWRRDFAEELIDAIFYDTVEVIRAEDAAREELRDQVAFELGGESG